MAKIKIFYKGNNNFLIIFIVILIYYIQHLIGFRLGMIYEESRDANAYFLAMQGYLPYRDFEWIYGPFSFFIYPFIMKIFGVNLIVLRISYMIFGSLVIPLTYFLARKVMPCYWAGIAAFLSIIFFDVPHYTSNHVFVILGELACLSMISRYIGIDKGISNLFWAGIFAGIVILTKPLLTGVIFFIAVSLFLLLFNKPSLLQKRFKDYLAFAISAICLISIYLLYFYSQTKLKHLTVTYPFLSFNSTIFIEYISRMNLSLFLAFFKKLKGLFPLFDIIKISSFLGFKKLLVSFFDNFIFFIPFIAPTLILLIYITLRVNKVRSELKEKILQDKNFLLLFVIFSIFIFLDSLTVTHYMGRAYNTQVPFILIVYILYCIKNIYSHRPIITMNLIGLFLFCIIFLDFFHFPDSTFKRFRNYTRPLCLERAKGIFVSPNEKELYESLSFYLSMNFDKEDKIVVGGYYPQFSFLTKQENIFEFEEYIFENLRTLLKIAAERKEIGPILASFEDKIISKMEQKRPKIFLTVTGNSLRDYRFLSFRIENYIEKNYYLDKIFGPADVWGMGGPVGWVNLYRLKENRS